jgi:hypothetical protein
MAQSSAFLQGQCLCGRLEGTRYGVVVDGLSAWSRRRGGECEVADGNALEMSEFPVLGVLVSRAGRISW